MVDLTPGPAEDQERSDGLIEVAEALVLKPGDRVLLLAKGPLTLQAADQIRHSLEKNFPDVEFTVASGFGSAIVERRRNE